MIIKRYRIRAIDDKVHAAMVAQGTPYIDIAANDIGSAWRKFVVQRFGALKPDPAQWDISLVRP